MQLAIIQRKIYELRGEKIMFDFDLAELYGVETKVLNQAVKRNLDRFPRDFVFQPTLKEWISLRSQFVTSNRGGRRYMPFAFTEHGVTMLASVLKSTKAAKMNVAIVRAFIGLRQMVLQYKGLAKKLAALEKKYNRQFKDVYHALNFLLERKKKEDDFAKRERIGFKRSN